MSDSDAGITDQSDSAAGSSHGLLGRTWALLRANWLIIGLFAVLYRVPNWLMYGICDVTGAPWCSPDPDDFEAFNRWMTSMVPNLLAGMETILNLLVGAVISTLFLIVLAGLWTGRWSRVGKNETREAIAGFSWTMVRRIIGVEVLIFVIGLPLYAAGLLAFALLDAGVNPSSEATSTLLRVNNILQFTAVLLSILIAPLQLLWVVAIIIDDLPVLAALRRTWATITRSPGAVAAPLLILDLAQPTGGVVLVSLVLYILNPMRVDGLWETSAQYWTYYWASTWFKAIVSIALSMASSTLAVGLWLRARDDRVEPAELWRGDSGADVAADSFPAAAQ